MDGLLYSFYLIFSRGGLSGYLLWSFERGGVHMSFFFSSQFLSLFFFFFFFLSLYHPAWLFYLPACVCVFAWIYPPSGSHVQIWSHIFGVRFFFFLLHFFFSPTKEKEKEIKRIWFFCRRRRGWN